MGVVIDFTKYRQQRQEQESACRAAARAIECSPPVTARIETKGGYMSAEVDVAAFLADRPNADLRALIKGVGWAKLDLIDWACEQYEPVRQIVEHVEFAADTDQAVECDVRLFNRELLAWLAVHRPALVSCLVASNS